MPPCSSGGCIRTETGLALVLPIPAGRTGVSAKRLSRLPLLRSIAPLADRLSATASRIPVRLTVEGTVAP